MALRPVGPAHGLLADVPHGVDPFLDQHVAGGRLARHPQPFRRGHGARRAPAPSPDDHLLGPDPPAASSSTPVGEPTRPSTRCGYSPTPARPAPSRSSGRRWRAGPRRVVWEFDGLTEAQYTVCSPTTGSSTPARWVGPVGRRLSIAPIDDAETPPTVAGSVLDHRPRTSRGSELGDEPDFARFTDRDPEDDHAGRGRVRPSATSAG